MASDAPNAEMRVDLRSVARVDDRRLREVGTVA
jgi:hypothetical protein